MTTSDPPSKPRVWEETWQMLHPWTQGDLYDADGNAIDLSFSSSDSPDTDGRFKERAKLATQAPAMARLLRDLLATSEYSGGAGPYPESEIRTVLKAAGVVE